MCLAARSKEVHHGWKFFFSTGGDVALTASALNQVFLLPTPLLSSMPWARLGCRLADEVESGLSQSTPAATSTILTGDEAGMGNSGVDRTKNFALLGGDREWVFVYAKTAITAGDLCEWDFDHGIAYAIDRATTADQILQTLAGVADNDIAAGSYGWIIKKGTCVVLCNADVTAAGEPLASQGTDGMVDDDGAAGTAPIGVALEGEGITLDTFVQAYINIP